MSTVRVIITGSRNFAERYNNLCGENRQLTPSEANEAKRLDTIDLRKAWKYFHQALKWAIDTKAEKIIYVHGDCPRGFDKICSEWLINAKKANQEPIVIEEEKHPADWVTHGPKAGPIRNTEIVDLGASFAISGWDGKTEKSGTLDCMQKLVLSGIDIKNCSPTPG